MYSGLASISASLFRLFFFKLPQNRHPERSASQMDRVTQRLWRGVEEPVLSVAEGTPAMLNYPCCSELFNHRSRQQDLLRYHWMDSVGPAWQSDNSGTGIRLLPGRGREGCEEGQSTSNHAQDCRTWGR